MKHRRLLLGVMLGALAVQLVVWQGQRGALALPGPRTGVVLPNATIRMLSAPEGGTLIHPMSSSPCALIVFVRTTCAVCERMRVTWPLAWDRWSDSVGASVPTVWVSDEARSKLIPFYRNYDFRGIARAQLIEPERNGFGRLGVYGTPTTYLVDRDGRLRMGVAGNQLPPADSARAACT